MNVQWITSHHHHKFAVRNHNSGHLALGITIVCLNYRLINTVEVFFLP